jgi:hypothetical protein
MDELEKALEDPQAAVELLLENPVIRRMILEGLRKVLEPLVVASNLTWLVFRSAFDLITDQAQIEEALNDPHKFFTYMLKKGGTHNLPLRLIPRAAFSQRLLACAHRWPGVQGLDCDAPAKD